MLYGIYGQSNPDISKVAQLIRQRQTPTVGKLPIPVPTPKYDISKVAQLIQQKQLVKTGTVPMTPTTPVSTIIRSTTIRYPLSRPVPTPFPIPSDDWRPVPIPHPVPTPRPIPTLPPAPFPPPVEALPTAPFPPPFDTPIPTPTPTPTYPDLTTTVPPPIPPPSGGGVLPSFDTSMLDTSSLSLPPTSEPGLFSSLTQGNTKWIVLVVVVAGGFWYLQKRKKEKKLPKEEKVQELPLPLPLLEPKKGKSRVKKEGLGYFSTKSERKRKKGIKWSVINIMTGERISVQNKRDAYKKAHELNRRYGLKGQYREYFPSLRQI